MTILRILLFIIGVALPVSASTVNKGNDCQRRSDGEVGVCRPLSECPTFVTNPAKNETLCGVDRQIPLVCCVTKSVEPPAVNVVALSLATALRPTSNDISISQKKCKEYSRFIYEDSKTEKCSIKADDSKIGRAAQGEFPHMVSLLYQNRKNITSSNCGGSLISEKFVLTAAHCLGLPRGSGLRLVAVAMGEVNISRKSSEDLQILQVAQKILHPDYNRREAPNYFDVGLVKLRTAPKLGPLVRPACLPRRDEDFSSRRLVLTGWGSTRGSKKNDILNKVILYEASYAVCAESYDKDILRGIHNSSQMCAGHPTKKSDSCQGDSGSPLQIISSDAHCMYTIVAVTSFGKRTCGTGVPGVYSRVQYFLRWIENTIWD